ncbi:hypothetical protein KUCAC02_023503 [Chaenocephalus aceratus]|uniref:Uncharacterized protein n=1 Tax=Chaenocephalus aceratus TaxID=36190 RepID=A0ACB9XS87_CHAAC|nr:hypothetical protein KUCAC02_023503 [Chaenocephalus aceratus]
MSCMSLYLPYLAFPPPPCDTLFLSQSLTFIPPSPGSYVNPTLPTSHLFPPGLPTPRSPSLGARTPAWALPVPASPPACLPLSSASLSPSLLLSVQGESQLGMLWL